MTNLLTSTKSLPAIGFSNTKLVYIADKNQGYFASNIDGRWLWESITNSELINKLAQGWTCKSYASECELTKECN